MRQLAAALLGGASLREALRRVGVSESTYYRELHRSPELRSALDAAPKADGPARTKGPGARGTAAAKRPRAGAGQAPDAGKPAAKRARRVRPAQQADATPAGPAPATTPPSDHAAEPEPAAVAATAIEIPAADVLTPPMKRTRLSGLVRNPYSVGSREARAAMGRRAVAPEHAAGTAPSGADWIPPVAVLLLQLVVAIAVGAHPVVILLIALTSAVLLVAVRRVRVRVPDAEATAPAEAAGTPDPSASTNGQGPHPDGPALEHRPMDLRWIAATILPAGRPPDDPGPPRQRN